MKNKMNRLIKLKERMYREIFENALDPLMALAIQVKYERLIKILSNRG